MREAFCPSSKRLKIWSRQLHGRNFANQQRRSKQQYDRTTKRLRLKLERMRATLQNFRDGMAPRGGEKNFRMRRRVDFEPARLERYLPIFKTTESARWFRDESTKEHAHRGTCDVCGQNSEWRCRNIGGKRIVTGCGEKGTSKTCTKCGFWQLQGFGVGKKEYKC